MVNDMLGGAAKVFAAKTVMIVAGVAVLAVTAAGFALRAMWIGQGAAEGEAAAAVARSELQEKQERLTDVINTCTQEKATLVGIIKTNNDTLKLMAQQAEDMKKRTAAAIAGVKQKFETDLAKAAELSKLRIDATFEEQCKNVDTMLQKVE